MSTSASSIDYGMQNQPPLYCSLDPEFLVMLIQVKKGSLCEKLQVNK
jgi:hypothetical protein